MDFIKSLDAYPKLKAEDTVRTTHGACASIIALVAMFYLFVSELAFYSTIDVQVYVSPLAFGGACRFVFK